MTTTQRGNLPSSSMIWRRLIPKVQNSTQKKTTMMPLRAPTLCTSRVAMILARPAMNAKKEEDKNKGKVVLSLF